MNTTTTNPANLTREQESNIPAGIVLLGFMNDAPRPLFRELSALVDRAGGLTAIDDGGRSLVRSAISSGAGLALHVLGDRLDHSERLLRCLRRNAEGCTVAAIIDAHAEGVECAARRAGANAYLVWPDDAVHLENLMHDAQFSVRPFSPPAFSSRREGVVAS